MSIIKKVEEIVKGYYSYHIHSTKEQQELSKQRMALCIQCKWYNSKENKCKLCGCIMPVKTLNKDSKCADTGYERW